MRQVPANPVQVAGPIAPEVGVIALVPDRWGPLWQVRHHVLTRLARYFNVAWVEPGIPWREVLHARRRDVPDPESPARFPKGFVPCTPETWLPDFRHPAPLARSARRLRLYRALGKLRRLGCTRTILYLWRPEFSDALEMIPFDLSCYHIDDEYSFARLDGPTSTGEEALIRSVDALFIHSPGLMEKKGSINPGTQVIPNGVDYAAYAEPAPEPTDLQPIGSPRIGYTGYLKHQLDWPLIEALVAARPDWNFVFVGPVSPHASARQAIDRLSSKPNAWFLGPKPAWELASYPQHFDVCILPYRRDAYTQYIYPLKLHEYLASGAAVVGACIRSLEGFADIIRLADTTEQWLAAIGEELGDSATTAVRRTARQDAARRHDWHLLVHRIAVTMAEGLGPGLAARVRAAGPFLD